MTTVRPEAHHRPSADAITPELKSRACAPVLSCEEALRRSHYLVRRISVVLFDLGLRETLPPDWAVPSAAGVDFGLLSHKEADRLVLTLELFIRDGRPGPLSSGPGQLSLFGRDA